MDTVFFLIKKDQKFSHCEKLNFSMKIYGLFFSLEPGNLYSYITFSIFTFPVFLIASSDFINFVIIFVILLFKLPL